MAGGGLTGILASKLEKRREQHRQAVRRYLHKLTWLGFKSGVAKPETYQRQLAYNNAWNKANRAKCRLAWSKYRAKLRAEYGATTSHYRHLAAMKRAEERLKRRKELADATGERLLRGVRKKNNNNTRTRPVGKR